MAKTSIPIARTWLAFLALGAAAFTLYGSLVPFVWLDRSWDEAIQKYRWVWTHRILVESRADALANCLLGFPVGFGLLGALRLDQPQGFRTIATGLAVIPVCFLFASAVEFSQLWVLSRTCAASDVLAQTLGATMGVAIWLGFGEQIVRFARAMWDSPNIGGRFGRALVFYGVFLLAVETLPWDFTASPGDWYRKRTQVTWVPFEELSEPLKYRVVPLDKSRAWVELVALFLPVGLLASGLPGLFRQWSGFPFVITFAFALGTAMELAQWPVVSRHPSVTDILIVSAAVLIGWILGRAIANGQLPVVIPVLGWMGLLAIYHWWPMDFDASVVRERLESFDLKPFFSLESKHPMMWLEEVAVKALIMAPIGAAAVAAGPGRAILLGLMLGLFYECGQLVMVRHYPSLTDVLLGGIGAAMGFMIAQALTREKTMTQPEATS